VFFLTIPGTFYTEGIWQQKRKSRS